jgi:hypothetical protein
VNWLSGFNAAISIINTDLTIKRNTEIGFFVLKPDHKVALLEAINKDLIDYDETLRSLLNELTKYGR